MCRILLGLVSLALLPAVSSAQDRVRPAIERILPLLERAAAGSAEHRECFTCHGQGLPVLAQTEARKAGFEINETAFQRQVDHTYAHLDRNREKYAKGEGTGGKADTAGYALWTLSAGGRAADETTAAVVEFLLSFQSDDQHWSCTSQRPPTEASHFTTTYLALRGLHAYGTEAQHERIVAREQAARGWLIAAEPQDNEDRVFRLLALELAGADSDVVAIAAQALISRQHPDGGWSQLDDHDSDAYATATALVSLQRTKSVMASDACYQRGVDFLLNAQLEDGSWHVVSRSEPFQTYFETGFPHGKDQFISTAASAWATLALLATYPETTSNEEAVNGDGTPGSPVAE